MGTKDVYRNCNATQRDVLYAIRVNEPVMGKEIASVTDYPDPTVSRALNALERKGLVEREYRGEFKKAGIYNRLTDKGDRVTRDAFDAYGEAV